MKYTYEELELRLSDALQQLDVQSGRVDALAAENAALKSSRDVLAKNALEACNEIYCAGYRNTALHDGLLKSTGNRNKYPNPIRTLVDESKRSFETTSTDAWVNEQRAVGVDSAIESAKKEIASEFQYQSFENCISACARHPQSDLSGKVEMVAWLELYAAQLRGSQV